MIHEAVRLFDKRPAILRRYRERFTHILVDEFQDTNYAQLQLIKQLAGDHLCVVGDDDQTIYRFRGAYLTNMQDFRQHFMRTAPSACWKRTTAARRPSLTSPSS